jgi:AcrR family transcriptional regulator
MPKITFFNLPSEKQENMILALKLEFSRAPLPEASISNIIKTAGVSRGSFYQYFDDKDDAFFFLLNIITTDIRRKFLHILEHNNGDLFWTMENFFPLIIQEEENFSFLRNTFLNMTYKIEGAFSRIFNDRESGRELEELGRMVDLTKLNIESKEELIHVMQILSAITFRNFVEKYARELNVEEACRQYRKELAIVGRGLCRH